MDDSRRSGRLERRNETQQLQRQQNATQRERLVSNALSRTEEQRQRQLQMSIASQEENLMRRHNENVTHNSSHDSNEF